MKRIILTGGGTAGHIMPIVALLPELRRHFGEIHFFGRSEGIEHKLTAKEDVIYHAADCPRLERGKVFGNVSVPFRLIAAVRRAKKLIAEIKPDVVFSKGGYVALPASLGAGKVPLVLHESDTSLGLANRLSARKAAVICSSFPLPPCAGKEVRQTGSQLRRQLYAGRRSAGLARCGFGGRRKVLLVTGGSLGARAINEAVDANLVALTEKYDVIHIRGRGNGRPPAPGYFPIEFTEDVYDYFAAADFAVTRGGGNTIFELGALGIPMLIVPLPKGASRGDQVRNAEYFAQHSLALAADQSGLPDRLCGLLGELEFKAPALIGAMKRYSFDGTAQIAELLAELAGA